MRDGDWVLSAILAVAVVLLLILGVLVVTADSEADRALAYARMADPTLRGVQPDRWATCPGCGLALPMFAGAVSPCPDSAMGIKGCATVAKPMYSTTPRPDSLEGRQP